MRSRWQWLAELADGAADEGLRLCLCRLQALGDLDGVEHRPVQGQEAGSEQATLAEEADALRQRLDQVTRDLGWN